MAAYDAYPFRLYAIAPDGTVAVSSDRGAAGFASTLARIEGWLIRRSESAAGAALPVPDQGAGARQRKPGKRLKSRSVVIHSHPDSMAMAAR